MEAFFPLSDPCFAFAQLLGIKDVPNCLRHSHSNFYSDFQP